MITVKKKNKPTFVKKKYHDTGSISSRYKTRNSE